MQLRLGPLQHPRRILQAKRLQLPAHLAFPRHVQGGGADRVHILRRQFHLIVELLEQLKMHHPVDIFRGARAARKVIQLRPHDLEDCLPKGIAAQIARFIHRLVRQIIAHIAGALPRKHFLAIGLVGGVLFAVLGLAIPARQAHVLGAQHAAELVPLGAIAFKLGDQIAHLGPFRHLHDRLLRIHLFLL